MTNRLVVLPRALDAETDSCRIQLQPISPLPETSPPLTHLEKEIVTENTFEGLGILSLGYFRSLYAS
jgi:hypothetical protein